MSTPHPWQAFWLILGAFRFVRLIGWDTFPIAERLRAWASGAETVSTGSGNTQMGLTAGEATVSTRYRRPTLEHFIGCPWCQGFWVCVIVWAAWQLEPRWTVIVLVPFAMSALVGLISKNADP